MKTYDKVDRLHRALRINNEKLTARQLASRYRVSNPYDLVYRLRSKGFTVYNNTYVNSRGETTTRYSM